MLLYKLANTSCIDFEEIILYKYEGSKGFAL